MKNWSIFLPVFFLALPLKAQDQQAPQEIQKTAYKVDGANVSSKKVTPVSKVRSTSVQNQNSRRMTGNMLSKREVKKQYAQKYPNGKARVASKDTVLIQTNYSRKKSTYKTK